jgi:hypothetical protein
MNKSVKIMNVNECRKFTKQNSPPIATLDGCLNNLFNGYCGIKDTAKKGGSYLYVNTSDHPYSFYDSFYGYGGAVIERLKQLGFKIIYDIPKPPRDIFPEFLISWED